MTEISKPMGRQVPDVEEVGIRSMSVSDTVDDVVNKKPDTRGVPNDDIKATSSQGKAVPVAMGIIERQASVDVEVDFEGVEAAKVEPSQFLEACKAIASIQITRDLGSDAAMNLSSALSGIPSEVEEACNVILTQQRNGLDKIRT